MEVLLFTLIIAGPVIILLMHHLTLRIKKIFNKKFDKSEEKHDPRSYSIQMKITCPHCKKKFKYNMNLYCKKDPCPNCSKPIDIINQSRYSYEQTYFNSEKNMDQNQQSIITKIISFFNSPRIVTFIKSKNSLHISFYHVSAVEIIKYYFPFVGLIIVFGIMPIIGIFKFLVELTNTAEVEYYMIMGDFIMILITLIPIFIVYKCIVPLLKNRSVILRSDHIEVMDHLLGLKSKVILNLPRSKLGSIVWEKSSILDKFVFQRNEKLILKHEKGEMEVIARYPKYDLKRIQHILKKYIGKNA